MDSSTSNQASYFTIGRKFINFCFVGVLNTGVDFFIYIILTRVLPFAEFILTAKALSYMAATTFSFFVNRRWTFEKKDSFTYAELFKFYTTVGLGIFINVGTQYVIVRLVGLNDLVGVLIAALITALWGFSFSNLYVFKR